MNSRRAFIAIAIVALLLTGAPVSAITVDGTLEPDYGVPLILQTTQTDVGDNTWTLLDEANGSELDAAYGMVADGVLHLFFTANLLYYPTPQTPTVGDFLSVFIDSGPGGQNVLASNNPVISPYGPNVNLLAGLTFDAGFEADYYLTCGGRGYPTQPPLRVFWATLPAGGNGTGAYLGASVPGGPGTLSGGTNPDGIEAALNNSNVSGVTFGCAATSGAGAATGVELAIPVAAIGNPTGCIRVCAFIGDTFDFNNRIYNQVLGPLPPGNCDLGPAPGVNFATIEGSQFFTICPVATPAYPMTWGSLKLRYR